MKCKRILSLLLTLCMVMSLFAGTTVTASAASGATTLYVNGVDMLNGSSTAPTGVSYDKSTNTLTLTNAELSTPYSGKDDGSRKLTAIIYSKQGLTINLVGNSTITYADSQDAKMLMGIMNTYGDLKFTGDGSLTIKNAVETGGTDKLCYGIDAYGTLTVDGPTITIDAEKTDTLTCQAEYGVLLMGTFAINSGTVTIRTRNTTGNNTALYTINGKDNTLGSGAKLIAEAGNRSSGDTNSYGIITESSLQLGAGASLRASGGEKALKIDNDGMIKAASADLTLFATGSTTPKATTKDLEKISSDMNTLTSLQYKTIEVTASAAGGAAEYATAELKLNGYTAGAAFDQATITTTSSTGFKSISLAGFMDDPDGKSDLSGTFSGTKTYYVILKMPRSTGYELQEEDGKPVGVTLEGATPEPFHANKDFLIFKMNSRPAAAAPTFTDGFGNANITSGSYTVGNEYAVGSGKYVFAGWYASADYSGGAVTEFTNGTTYYAKWTKNGKTVRTTALDFYNDASNEWKTGCTQNGTRWTNAAEGWSWDTASKTLTLSGATFDVNKQSTEQNIEGSGAILLPANASVTTKKGTENTVHNGSTIETALGTYIGSGIVSEGAFTIKGDGELSVTAGAFGVFAGGDVSIEAPISIVCTETKGNVAAVVTDKDHSITIAPSLCIKTPTKGKVASSGVSCYIAEQDGQTQTPARKVVIGVAAPTFTDGLGKADCTFDTYTKGAKNDKGYIFAGWFDGDTELENAEAAVAGTTYTAKWTKNGKTVRTAVLDLTKISESNTFGATLTDGVYTNADEGWNWDTASKTLTLSGATFDVNKQSTESNIEGIGAILLPDNASVTTKKGTENTVHNGSTIRTAMGTYIGSGIVSEGAFTIKGDGELSVTAGAFGVFAVGDVSIEAPISIVCTETKGNVAAVVAGKGHSITIAPSLCIKTPTKGKVASSGVGRYIAEQDGQTPARKVVIGVAAPTFTDGLGKADCTFDTYTKGRENDKGYTFAGWFGDDGKELTSAADATVGTTYTAKWTKNGKTVRTAVLDLTEINEENTFGATLADGVYTNADEGWSWNPKTETLTLSGVTFDVNKQSTEPNIEGIGAILLPRNASVTTKKGTENTVHNGSTIGTKLGTYIGSGIVSGGAFTIKGDGELSVTAGAFGVLAMGDVSIGAPISIVCTETKGNVAAVVTGKDHSITIAPSLCIKTPTKGKVASSDVGRYIAEQDGQTPARKVVIGYTVPSSSGGSSGSGGSSSGNSSTISTPSAKNGTVSVSPKSASKGTTVTVTVTPDKGYVLETLTVTDASGKKLDLKNLGSGKYSFTMPASKVEAKATFMEDNTMLNYFVDVPASAYYYDAVLWAAEQGITGGTDATHFSPDGVCTRAQAVTFLWRAAGSPAPSATAMPFTDVAADSYYYNAVLWAMENGITVGTSSTTFSPDLKCSRAHIMTFLWRSEKSPAAGSVNPFTDVSADAYYADAVLWAVKESVTNGTSSATFSPDADCTRAQIVTFIWRTLAR